ncbi:MAG: helix-turn-helix domain-containing protein, partial [Dehalococcoidia bacterium]
MITHVRDVWALGLSPAIKLVLLSLADMANEEDECWPGQELIGRRTGLSLRSVQRALEDLGALGLLTVVAEGQRAGRGRMAKARHYRLNLGDAVVAGEASARPVLTRPWYSDRKGMAHTGSFLPRNRRPPRSRTGQPADDAMRMRAEDARETATPAEASTHPAISG